MAAAKKTELVAIRPIEMQEVKLTIVGDTPLIVHAWRDAMNELYGRKRWTSLAALMLVLLFAGAADGLMDVLGPVWFLLVGALVMGTAWALERRPQ